MTKKKYTDVWVTQDRDGTVNIWKGRRKPKLELHGEWYYASDTHALRDLLFEELDNHTEFSFGSCHADIRKPGWFVENYGAEHLPGAGEIVGLLLEGLFDD